MTKYLLDIDSKDLLDWKEFRKQYKGKKLGSNLGEAIMTLIKKSNAEEEVDK